MLSLDFSASGPVVAMSPSKGTGPIIEDPAGQLSLRSDTIVRKGSRFEFDSSNSICESRGAEFHVEGKWPGRIEEVDEEPVQHRGSASSGEQKVGRS